MKFVAKIASDFAKPNGQKWVREDETRAFLAALPIARLWGVGPKTEERLRGLNLRTIGDVAARDLRWLETYVGSGAQHFHMDLPSRSYLPKMTNSAGFGSITSPSESCDTQRSPVTCSK